MTFGNPKAGILLAIIDMMNESDPTQSYDSNQITARLRAHGHWDNSRAKTPERTVNSYFSQNPHIFQHTGRNKYCLKIDFVKAIDTPQIDDTEATQPVRVTQNTYRILRDTDMARRLKALHSNKCQLCGQSIALHEGPYSEAHHIWPLGSPHNGPDVAGNILVLCPNHHVMCDYGALYLSADKLATAPQHAIGQEYLDYHNSVIFKE